MLPVIRGWQLDSVSTRTRQVDATAGDTTGAGALDTINSLLNELSDTTVTVSEVSVVIFTYTSWSDMKG